MSANLIRRGHSVQVVVPEIGWLPTILEDANIPVHVTWMKGRGWTKTMAYLIREVRRNKIDVVHTHLTRAAYIGHAVGTLLRVPVVTSVHIANNDRIYRRLARRSNRLVAVSNFVAGMLHGNGVPKRYIDTVYNGTDFVEVAQATPFAIQDELGISREAELVGVVAKVCRDKGQVEMVRAMAALRSSHPKAHLLLVGRVEDQYRPELESTIDELGMGKHVTIAGIRHDVPQVLDNLTLSTLPSVMETFGLAAIEAMARQKAVVATRVGALPEVVRDGHTGLLVDLRPDSIAEAVSHLLVHDELREEMGRQGRRIVEQKFTLQEMARRFEEVYASAYRS